MEAYPESEQIGTLWQLSERCRLGVVEAWIEACVAAADLCGGEYGDVEADWLRAWRDLEDVKTELRREWLGPLRDLQPVGPEHDERVRSALAEFYERLDHALRRWERWAADEEDDGMATATKAKRQRRAARREAHEQRCSVRRDEHGVLRWTCPACHTEHDDTLKACPCEGYTAPPLGRLQALLEAQIADGPLIHDHGRWTCPACRHDDNHVSETTCSRCRWDGQAAFEQAFADGWKRMTGPDGWGRMTGQDLDALPATQAELDARKDAAAQPRKQGKARRKAAASESAADGVTETVVLQFRPAARCVAAVELQDRGGTWAYRRIVHTNGWLKDGRDRGGKGGMTETLDAHHSPPPASRHAALRLALLDIQAQLGGIAAEALTKRGRLAQNAAIEDVLDELTRMLGQTGESRESGAASAASADSCSNPKAAEGGRRRKSKATGNARQATAAVPHLIRLPAGPMAWVCPACSRKNELGLGTCPCGYERPPLRKFAHKAEDRTGDSRGSGAASAVSGDAAAPQTIDVPLDQIDENPLNTRRNWGDLTALAASFQKVGQLQECTGRRQGARVELVAGGRRYRAAKLAGVPALRVRIVACDDLAALDIMGEENEKQQTWDCISRAAWLQAELDARQCSTRDLAAHLGVSQADVANHTRLLKLPEAWQQRVISGEITPSMARSLVPWAARPAVLEGLEQRCRKDKPETVEDFERGLADVVEGLTRPCEPGRYFQFRDGKTWRHGDVRLTPKDLEQRGQDLDVVELSQPGWKGKTVKERRAFNVALWDELQTQREREREARSARAAAGKGAKKASGEGSPPKRTAEEEKRLRQQQARQLATKVWRYKVRWLQARAAQQVLTAGTVGIKLLLAFAGTDDRDGRRRTALAEVVKAAGGKSLKSGHDGVDAWRTVASIETGAAIPDLARQVLSAWLALDVFAGWRVPLHPSDVVVAAAELGVDLEREWRCDQAFLELFTKEQLADLATEWGREIDLGLGGTKRSGQIKSLLTADVNKRLPVPKVLAKAKGA
jgi:ParB/RepB/Spo0J family partition protein